MKRWYEHEANGISSKRLADPYSYIVVGSDPRDGMKKETASQFTAVINVSDTMSELFEPAFPWQKMFWYPIHEGGYWGYAPFYWFKCIMDRLHKSGNEQVYVHCHAGAYRSPSMVEAWLTSRGHSWREAEEIVWGKAKHDYTVYERNPKRFYKGSSLYTGNVPKNLEKFYELMNKNPDHCLASMLYGEGMKEITRETWGAHLWDHWLYVHFKYYFETKWWLREKKDLFKIYLAGDEKTPIPPPTPGGKSYGSIIDVKKKHDFIWWFHNGLNRSERHKKISVKIRRWLRGY